MEFEQFKDIVEVVSRYFEREVTAVNVEDKDIKLRTGFFVEFTKDGFAKEIIFSKKEGEPLFNAKELEIIRKRNGTFLKNVGYDDSEMLLLIMGIIHEFGHMAYYDIVQKHDFDLQYRFLRDMTGKYIRTAWAKEKYEKARSESGDDLIYMSRADEMYCDGFAKDHFIPIIKLIEEKGLL